MADLQDPTDGSQLQTIDVSDISSLAFANSQVLWACLDTLIPEFQEYTGIPEIDDQDDDSNTAYIAFAEEFVLSNLAEMMDVTSALSLPQDFYAPVMGLATPEPIDAEDFRAKKMSWEELEALEPADKLSMLARRFRGDFIWEATSNELSENVTSAMAEESQKRRHQGSEEWNPPQAHDGYRGNPNEAFAKWLKARIEGGNEGPPQGSVINCWEAALVIAVMANLLDPKVVKQDVETGDPYYVMKYFLHGYAHQDLRMLPNAIKAGDFLGIVADDLLVHVAIVLEENQDDYREIVTMSHGDEDFSRYTRIKWGKAIRDQIANLQFHEAGEGAGQQSGGAGNYLLYGPFATKK